MSASPTEKEDVDQAARQSGDEQDPKEMEGGDSAQGLGDFEVKEQDRWLPIANVARIMKTALPENAKIAKEAKECMQECVSEFISFITSEASEKCQQEKRKTVNGEDILFAMTSLGFENYAEALKIYLSKYRETQSARGENQQQSQNRPTSSGGSTTGYVGGPVGGVNPVAGGGLSTAATTTNPANNILSPHTMDPEQETSPSYGYAGMVPTGNGTSGDGY